MEALSLIHISKIYQDRDIQVQALMDISLEIKKGEFVVLAGPSGSGKTTLLNILGTLDQPDSGQVYLDGQDVSGLPNNTLAEIRLNKIGFIFQSTNLIDVLTARENIEYVMLLQGMESKIRRKKSFDILKAVGLEGLADRKTYQMSGGQGQRVAVARAVVAEPQLILADEPTANLDSKTGELLIELMESFNRSKQITFIIASHDPMVINRAGRIIQLKDGKILEDRKVDC
jgi:putative ABC transport system ATP-binding protein